MQYGVEVVGSGACESCALVKNCHGVGSIVWTRSATTLYVGQIVHLEMLPGAVLRVAGWGYGMPLVAVVAGILAGYLWLFAGSAENVRVLLSTATGIGTMLAVGVLMSRMGHRLAKRSIVRATPAERSLPELTVRAP